MMAVAIAVPGLAVAPTLITGNSLVQGLAPAEEIAEAFAWLGGTCALGSAGGAVLVGRLVDTAGPHWGFLVPAIASGAAGCVVAASRSLLQPRRPIPVGTAP
jgi:MFS family permease